MRRLVIFLAAVASILSVGLVVPVSAEEQDTSSTDADSTVEGSTNDTDYLTFEIENDGTQKQTQVAQGAAGGITGYEVPRRVTTIGRGETVENRPRPEYDPLGIHAGSFLIFPSVGVEEQYQTNIYYTPSDETDDFITRILPGVTAQSTWSNHSLRLQTGADVGIYADNSDEDYQDYFVDGTGRIDIRRSTNLTLNAGYAHDHESRASPDDPGTGKEPTQIDIYSAAARFYHTFGRINARLTGTATRFTYDDVDLAAGPGKLINHDRDRNEYTGALRVGYEIVPSYEAFVQGTYNVREYDGDETGTGINKDSHGYEVAAGVALDLTGVLFGELFVGYLSQDYDSSSLDDFSGVGGGGQLTWNVTRLTTITGTASSAVRETDVAGASGSLVTAGEINVDHELLRNLLIGADARVTRDDFEGISRVDWIYGAGADATYLINRYLSAGIDYTFEKRDSDANGEDFENHVFLARVRLQY